MFQNFKLKVLAAGAKSGCEEEVCEQDEKHCKCRQSGPEARGEAEES